MTPQNPPTDIWANGTLPGWAKVVLAVGVVPSILAWLIWIVTGTLTKISQDHAALLTESQIFRTKSDQRDLDIYNLLNLVEKVCRRVSESRAAQDDCTVYRPGR